MTRDTDAAVVREVLSLVLGLDQSVVDNTLRSSEPSWDSLKHVEIVLTLESALGIAFDESEFDELVGVESIVRAVERRRAA